MTLILKFDPSPFEAFSSHIRNVGIVLEASKIGLKLLVDTRPADQPHLIQEEVANDYPVINTQLTVYLWSALESATLSFLTSWVSTIPSALDNDQIRKIKISLAEYEMMVPEARWQYLIKQLEDNLNAPFKQGVNRFENLLKVFGLDGAVDKDIKDTLFELQQVRNVIVHQRGIADHRFVEKCSHLGYEHGQEVRVTSEQVNRYVGAVVNYVHIVLTRVHELLQADIKQGQQ